MRAIRVTAHGQPASVELVETDRPSPGPRQVLIDVEAIGVNYSDVMQFHGDYYGGPSPPYTPGTEVAGTISEVGADADREAGERVAALVSMADGAYAEYVLADAGVVFDLPESMPFAEAAGFPVQFTTAHCALVEWGELSADDRVLVHSAAGGVGTAAVQIAAHVGAEIFATASTQAKLDLAADLGADHGIDYTATDFREPIADATDGEGVDLVLDGVGGEVFTRSVDALAPFGRVVTYGQASGEPSSLDNRDVFFENRTIHGFHLGNALQHRPRRVFSAISRLSGLFAEASIRTVLDREFPLEDALDAWEYVADRQSTGKVVLVP